MHHRDGFSLIELLVYLFFFALLASSSVLLISRWYTRETHLAHDQRSLISLHTAHDLIVADVQQARPLNQWKMLHDDAIVFSTEQTDICWQKKDNTLIRITGRYHVSEAKWSEKTMSVVAQSITTIKFETTPHNIVHFMLKDDVNIVEGYAQPRGR